MPKQTSTTGFNKFLLVATFVGIAIATKAYSIRNIKHLLEFI